MQYDVVVIGGGPAGLAAAHAAWEAGCPSILIVERDRELGGILNQCIHNGFGLHRFKEELTGPEYAERFVTMLRATNIEVRTDTMVLQMTAEKHVHLVSATNGYEIIQARSIVLAMGCRERTRGAIAIPGTRPAGIFTAGTAQRYVNMEGKMIGKRVVILGSGDIGLIMARRMTLEGAKVLACIEVLPYSGGLNRNIVQCLNDFDIPLLLSHTITDIQGHNRVERVLVSAVDENRVPIPNTETVFECDTLLLSVGLIPENELSRAAGIEIDPKTGGPIVYENMETSIPGVFACGNVVQVHDLVDFVSEEGKRAGIAAATYCSNPFTSQDTDCMKHILAGKGIRYTVPQHFKLHSMAQSIQISFRVTKIYHHAKINIRDDRGKQIACFLREHVTPGEMENICVPRSQIENMQGHLSISVEEETPT